LIRGFDMEVLLGVVAELLDFCLIKKVVPVRARESPRVS